MKSPLQWRDRTCESSNARTSPQLLQKGKAKEGNRAPIIKRSLEPLQKDLSDMKEMLHECTRKPSVHVVDKVRYLVLYKAKLDGFREKLPAHRESISVIQELIEGQSQSERRASTVKLSQLLANQERQQKKQDEYDRIQREVVKIFEERLPSTENAQHLSSREILEQLEDDLVAKGVSRGKAEEQLFPMTKALLLNPLPINPNRGPAMEKPSFKLDVFESASHTTTTCDLRRSKSKGNSEYNKANTATRRLDARAASSDNLSALSDDNYERLSLQKASAGKQGMITLVPETSIKICVQIKHNIAGQLPDAEKTTFAK
jgi:hypothetical protein